MKVSIVIPIFNTLQYVKRCVDSLLSQSYTNIEIILVDDGSTDGSGEQCDEYSNFDSRIKTIHKANGGESTARNAGLIAATGSYLMFCDSDDEYLPGSIEKLVSVSQLSNVDLIVGAYLEKTGDVTKLACTMQQRYTTAEIVNKTITDPNPYGASYIMSTVNGKLFDLSILRERNVLFNESFVIGNDSLFILDYLKDCYGVFDIFDPVYVYYKFDISERVQGMSWVYPDYYKFLLEYSKKISLIKIFTEQGKQVFCQRLFDSLIREMITAAAYEEYLCDTLENELTTLVNVPLAIEAAKWYRRERITDSKKIPLYFREKNVSGLIDELRNSATKKEKQKNVRLIYRGEKYNI